MRRGGISIAEALALGNVTLAELAKEEGLSAAVCGARVVGSDGRVAKLSDVGDRQPLATVAEAGGSRPKVAGASAGGCDEIYRLLSDWQLRLAAAVGDEEEAAVLSEASLNVSKSHNFAARIIFPPEAKAIRVQFSVISGLPDQTTAPIVIWKQPRMRFRRLTRRRDEAQPLTQFLTAEQASQFAFGKHPAGGPADASDFVTKGPMARSFEFAIPEGVRGAEIQVEAQLDLAHGEDGVIRCEIVGGDKELPPKAVSAVLLADPEGAAFRTWKAGVLEFARLLPQVSHREPAPSRPRSDPAAVRQYLQHAGAELFSYEGEIPPRRPVSRRDDAGRGDAPRLDEAWTDLLGSFEYHDVFLRFVAEKFKVDLAGKSIATLDEADDRELAGGDAGVCRAVARGISRRARALRAAEPRHVDDALELASRAWRRPLTTDEAGALREFL